MSPLRGYTFSAYRYFPSLALLVLVAEWKAECSEFPSERR